MKDKLKIIWRILTTKYFVLLTWDDENNHVNIKTHYKKEHKQEYPIINDVVETIWKHIYFSKEDKKDE